MKRIIVIPARYASTRLPGKPLINVGGKPLLQWVYEGAQRSKLAQSILIATDNEKVRNTALAFGAETIMTDPALPSGTDRVCAAMKGRDADIVINLQGDEPFVEASIIDQLFSTMEQGNTEMATLCCPLTDERDYKDPNTVKVVLDRFNFALYFSRSSIPFVKTPDSGLRTPGLFYKHIGIYAFTRQFLDLFVTMPKSPLEETESLEQLRALENGHKIKVIVTQYKGFGIDTPSDLERARALLATK